MKKTPILDVCCGGKMFYFDHDDPNVTFCDIRELDTNLCDGRKFSIHPDVKCDFTDLPFEDETYKMVVFDPPHLLGESNGWQKIKYGWLDRGNWRETLRQGFFECFRVLEKNGFLIFKWNDTNISVKEILELTPEKPIFGHRVGKLNKTHWIVFMKK